MSLIPAEGTETAVLFTRSGDYIYLNLETAQATLFTGKFRSASDNVRGFYAAKGCYLLQPYSSNHIGQYTWVKDPGLKKLFETQSSPAGMVTDKAGSRAAVLTYAAGSYEDGQGLSYYEIQAGKQLWATQMKPGEVILPGISGETGEVMAVNGNAVVFLDGTDGSRTREIPLEGYYQVQGINRQGDKLLASDLDSLYTLSLADGKKTVLSGGEWQLSDYRFWSIGPSLTRYAAASEQDQRIYVYEPGRKEAVGSLPVKAAYLSSLCFNEEDTVLYVSYQNGRTEAYRMEDMKLMSTYDGIREIQRTWKIGEDTLLDCGTQA